MGRRVYASALRRGPGLAAQYPRPVVNGNTVRRGSALPPTFTLGTRRLSGVPSHGELHHGFHPVGDIGASHRYRLNLYRGATISRRLLVAAPEGWCAEEGRSRFHRRGIRSPSLSCTFLPVAGSTSPKNALGSQGRRRLYVRAFVRVAHADVAGPTVHDEGVVLRSGNRIAPADAEHRCGDEGGEDD